MESLNEQHLDTVQKQKAIVMEQKVNSIACMWTNGSLKEWKKKKSFISLYSKSRKYQSKKEMVTHNIHMNMNMNSEQASWYQAPLRIN